MVSYLYTVADIIRVIMAPERGFRSTTVLSDETRRIRGTDAQAQNVQAGVALADTVRSTLGPNGRDKMIVGSDGTVVVTNDGASIVDRLEIDHPAARAIVEVAGSQDEAIGDGTTTAILLTGALLEEASGLLDEGLHPTAITAGYQRAAERATRYLDVLAREVDTADDSILESLARTAITGRWDDDSAAFVADLALEGVRAVTVDGSVERGNLRLKPVIGGSLRDSAVIDGVIVNMDRSSTTVSTRDFEAPRHLSDAGIAIVDGQLTIDEAAAVSNVTVTTPEELQRFREHEESVYRDQVERIVDSGADVVFCQKSVDDGAQQLLAAEGILTVERTRRDELHALEYATGASAVADTDELTADHVGFAGSIDRRTVAGTELTAVTDCVDADLVSVLLRGGTEHVLDETKRIVEDCLDVTELAIESSTVLPGGGAPEIDVASELREDASGVSGREQLAVKRFADALEVIPRTLARASGHDPIDTIIELRGAHHEGRDDAGFDVTTGTIAPMTDRGVLEPLDVKQRAVTGACEAANVVLRIDDVVAARRQNGDGAHGHDHDHDHGPAGVQSDPGGYPWAIGH